MKKIIKLCFLSVTVGILLLVSCYLWITYSSKAYLYDDLESIPYNQYSVVLGTSKFLKSGGLNPYYTERIRAASHLYQAGKTDYIIVSGSNPSIYYNEPQQMRQDLILNGVPANKITADYAGIRTLDSILRVQHVFSQQKYTIISQAFHNQRAIFLSHAHGQQTIAYNAQTPPFWEYGLKTQTREVAARIRAVLDIYIFNQKAGSYSPVNALK